MDKRRLHFFVFAALLSYVCNATTKAIAASPTIDVCALYRNATPQWFESQHGTSFRDDNGVLQTKTSVPGFDCTISSETLNGTKTYKLVCQTNLAHGAAKLYRRAISQFQSCAKGVRDPLVVSEKDHANTSLSATAVDGKGVVSITSTYLLISPDQGSVFAWIIFWSPH